MLKITFINPPHADWCLPQTLTFMSMQSHYTHFGKSPNDVQWIEPPFKWDQYTNIQQVYDEVKEADIILFSSYVWNYDLVDEIAALVKKQNPTVITMIGGPHIGFDKPGFAENRWMYDYVATPTTPGEIFITDFLDRYLADKNLPLPNEITYEARSLKKANWEFLSSSLYEAHADHLKRMCDYADTHNMEKFIVLETTRGCPYKCSYCEWGGGLGTKIIKKDIEVVKRDILAIKAAGYSEVYSADANFGVFEERDREILLFASANGIKLTDISVVKAKNLDRRKRIVNMFYDAGISWDVHIPIQSISEAAMKVSNRTDLTLADKIELGKYIKKMAEDHGYTRPGIEMIMAMPGSTLDDFYNEYELLMDFQALGDHRHVYMVLPDSEAASSEYVAAHDLELVDVYSDALDEDNASVGNSLYKHRKSHFKTIASSFSYSREDMHQMFFMNYAAPKLINEFYYLCSTMAVADFVRLCYAAISNMPEFAQIAAEVEDIFDPATPARNISRLQGKIRTVAVDEFVDEHSGIITAAIMEAYLTNYEQ